MIANTKLTRRLRKSSRCVPSPLLVRHRRRPAKRKPTSGSIQLKPANKNALILHKLRNYKDGHCNRSATCTPAADNRLRLRPCEKKEQDQKVTESAVSSAVLSIHCKLTQKCNQNIERNRPVNIKFRLDPLSNFNHSRAGILTIARDGGSRPNPRNHFALCSHTRYFCRGLEKSTARFPI